MRDNRGGATLGAEAVSGSSRCCERSAKDFNGDVASKGLISCTEDECRRPFANQLLQSISASNDVTRLQCSLVPS
jgi:hypothetical protein